MKQDMIVVLDLEVQKYGNRKSRSQFRRCSKYIPMILPSISLHNCRRKRNHYKRRKKITS